MSARAWMQSIDRKIWSALAEFLFLSVLAMLVPVAIWADMRLFNDGYSEMPCSELSQEIFVLISAVIFAVEASRRAHARGFLILVAGFFACLLVREGDAYLDRWVFQSFWIWPAGLIAISAVACAVGCRETILKPMALFVGTKSQLFITIGLVVLLAYSRTMGSGEMFWKHIINGPDYQVVKTAVQEGLELFGYLFICYGSVVFWRDGGVSMSLNANTTEEGNPART